ncbi:MAG TPA: polyprenyl synthetase family protein [Chitinophagaceae bacterium]|nr:polyprenyl synthetase family protein [Chitinophagaceae bacterium]
MQSFSELLSQFEHIFAQHHFPTQPSTLYEPCSYLLNMGGKRIRPVVCLMSHELFEPLNENVWNTAIAIELFHNFTLMHDDIMDQAPLRRGFPTVHEKYNVSTAILSGDVMNIYAYEHLNKIQTKYIHLVLELFNKTAIEICEGQQLDMDYEQRPFVSPQEYLDMITLKTSVLLGTSLKLGAMLGGATDGCSEVLYEYGKCAGIAFQLKDDLLDAYGAVAKTGKQIGGDILSNKKTYLSTKAYELANEDQKKIFAELLARQDANKVEDTLRFFDELGVKQQLEQEIIQYTEKAYEFLEKVPVMDRRKTHLRALTDMLLKRES